MTLDSAQKRIQKLQELIAVHIHHYHTLDTPTISDEAYDALVRELADLEKKYPQFTTGQSSLQQVGGKILEGFKKTKHLVSQWSYDNVFDIGELTQWEERNQKILDKNNSGNKKVSYVTELKIDGLKLVLTYKKGELVTGATRGDGEVGEDITENIRMIKHIPQTISEKRTVVIVGECWMKKSDLLKINQERKKQELPLYANPRNLAAGTLRQLDTSVVASRDLKTFFYDMEFPLEAQRGSSPYVGGGQEGVFTTHHQELVYLKKLGFSVNEFSRVCHTREEIQKEYDYWATRRDTHEYGVDGLVIKINETSVREILGYTAKSPRFGVAYKFPAEEVTTVVENIDVQVGRTGVLTPVAHVRPVLVAGSTVARATLHNQDEIDRLDVRIGDTVILRKAGDIIPEILQVILELRPKSAKKYSLPSKCPVCEQAVSRKKGGLGDDSVALYCINRHCPAQSLENLIHFASKKAMNIVGMGEKIVEKLVQHNLIQTPVDIYNLKKTDLENLEKFGDLSASNLLASIEESKNITLPKFLFALGIHHIGEETAELVATMLTWKTNDELFQKLISLTDEDLIKINGIGETVAESFVDYMTDPQRQKVVHDLIIILKFEKSPIKSIENSKFSGKVFVVTGTLEKFSRDEVKSIIKKNGGKVASSVSKNTDYVVVGENPGSKYDEAVKLEVETLDEENFTKMI